MLQVNKALEKGTSMDVTSLLMVSKFGAFISARLEQLDWSPNFFAGEVSIPSPWLYQIISGKRTPPLERMEEWASKLKLYGEDRSRFFELAWLAHAPEEVGNIIQRYRAHARVTESEIAELRKDAEERVKMALTITEQDAIIAAQTEKIAELQAVVDLLSSRVASAERAGYRV